MATFTRVRDKRTGHEYSTARVDPDHHVTLDEPATRSGGKPLPAKTAEKPGPSKSTAKTSTIKES